MENQIADMQALAEYLSEKNDEYSKLKNSFDKIMVLGKLNELVFWLNMWSADLMDKINESEDRENETIR